MALAYDTSDAPHITVARCGGDLAIIGTDQRQIVVMGDEDEIHAERQGESFTLTADDDCDIHCPMGTSITIKQVSGDADLRDVGPTTLHQVSGDLEVRDVNGELRIESVSGDAKLRQISGVAVIESVRGDLSARDLVGGATVKSVSGDVSLSTALADGASYQFEARGDISAKVEVGSVGARFTLEASDLHCRLPLQFSERSSHRMVGTLGEGKAELILRARGDLAISERGETWGPAAEVDWESAMDAWAQQFEVHMQRKMAELEKRLAHLPFVDSEHITRRAQEAAERARRQAERAAERARARAERASRKHGHRGAEFRVSWASPQPPQPPQPPKPAGEPISDAERMAILKMVADKKITAGEASRLLAALEGEA